MSSKELFQISRPSPWRETTLPSISGKARPHERLRTKYWEDSKWDKQTLYMLALCKIEVTKGLTITAPMMKSSTPKLPADPVSFDVNRRQNTRTAKELNKTPTTRTLLDLSLGTTPQVVLLNFSVAVQLARVWDGVVAWDLLKASRVVQFWLIHVVILAPNSTSLQMQAVSVSEHVEFETCCSMQRSCFD